MVDLVSLVSSLVYFDSVLMFSFEWFLCLY